MRTRLQRSSSPSSSKAPTIFAAPAVTKASAAGAPAFDFGAIDVMPSASAHLRTRPLRGGTGCAIDAPSGMARALAAAPAPRLADVAPEASNRGDLGGARIHDGPMAESMARSLGARAFTLGSDVVFGAGAFAPRTRAGRALLDHELGHVGAGASMGPDVALRAPNTYDATGYTITPPTKPFTLKDAQDRVDARKKATPADLTSAAVKGVTSGSHQEIFLWHIIAVLGTRDRWMTETDLVTPIDWPAKPGDPSPVGKVTLTIDDKGNAVAELLSAGAVAAPAKYATRADAEKELKATYGIASVKDGDATWSPEELNKVIGAFALLPTADRTALAGVDLVRVVSLGATTAGQFESSAAVSGTTATISATLKLANRAFDSDDKSFVGGGTGASPASYQTIVHEVGHAIATKASRDATADVMKTTAKSNQLIQDFNATVDVNNAALTDLNAAIDDFNIAVGVFNADKTADNKKIVDDKKKIVDAKQKAFDAANKDMKAKETAKETGKADIKTKETAKAATMMPAADLAALKTTAETHHKAAATAQTGAEASVAKLSPDEQSASSAYRTAVADVGTALDDLRKGADDGSADLDALSDAVTTSVKARNTERDALKAAASTNPAITKLGPVEAAQDTAFPAVQVYVYATRRTARVHAFVKFVNSKGIAPFTTYARENWPHKPEEFYAEAYSLWRTDPAFLKTNYPALSTWFDGAKYK